jgi:hypothetical protein
MNEPEKVVSLADAKPALIADAVLRTGDEALAEAATVKGVEKAGRAYRRARIYLIEYKSYAVCFIILLLYFCALYAILEMTMRGTARDEKVMLIVGSGIVAVHLVLSVRQKREAARVVERAQAARLLEASARAAAERAEFEVSEPSVGATTRGDHAQQQDE